MVQTYFYCKLDYWSGMGCACARRNFRGYCVEYNDQMPPIGSALRKWALFAQLICLLWIAYWLILPPSLGEGVLLLGLVAALMTLHADMKSWHRAVWIFILAWCAFLEFKAISVDHNDQRAIRDREEASFTKILKREDDIYHTDTDLAKTFLELKNVPHIPMSPNVAQLPKGLKERTLLLAKDILESLSQQLRTGNTSSWGDFITHFGTRISDVAEELASVGLPDPELRLVPKARIQGDTAAWIRREAEKISDLGSLLPPDGIFKDRSDIQLAYAIEQKADKLDAMLTATMNRLTSSGREHVNPDFIRADMFDEFNECCKDAIKNLRGVALQRLPGAADERETRAFLDLMHMAPGNPWNPIDEYAPYLRHLGEELKSHPQK
jgi:hypothetical protein